MLFRSDGLKQDGFELTYDPALEKESLTQALQKVQPEVLVVRSTKVPAEMIDAASSVKLIIRAGSGVDNIDVKHASEKDVMVANCPGMNAIAVAELVMGLMLAVDRRIPDGVQLMRDGKWRKGDFVKQPGVYGRTVGCLGFGFVAQEVAIRAKAFGMNVQTFTIPVIPADLERTGAKTVDSVEELFKTSDFITLHVPKTKTTLRMVNEKLLSLMKPDAVLINTARGDLVNTADMETHLKKEKKFFFASDVHDGEPNAKKADFPASGIVQ